MKSIWRQLNDRPRPFFVLAPMDDVTDTAFRQIVAEAAAPDLMITEFSSTDGFVHPEGRGSVERRLRVNESEVEAGVPVIAQIWGGNPDHYYETTRELADRGVFAGIDINMGCPEKSIVKRGCCGGLIKPENWDRAASIIEATKQAARGLPVSIKTRIGVGRGDLMTEEWCSFLLEQGIDALTIHARTVHELSRVPARWSEIAKVVKLRDEIAPETVIVGNGDVENRKSGDRLAAESGADGVMIGRGVFHDLFAFDTDPRGHSAGEMMRIMLKHIDLYEKTWGATKSYDPLKKFFKIYISGFPGAANLRMMLMETRTADEARAVIRTHVAKQDATLQPA